MANLTLQVELERGSGFKALVAALDLINRLDAMVPPEHREEAKRLTKRKLPAIAKAIARLKVEQK